MFKYYNDQLIVGRSDAHIAIITGWTKKESIHKALLDSNLMHNVAVIGQLYSKEGINYIIRNIYLNPHINYIIMIGKDLSGAMREFTDLISGGPRPSFIHKEIPDDALTEFANHFGVFRDKAYDIDGLLELVKYSDKQSNFGVWIDTVREFDNPEFIEGNDYPSEIAGFRLEGDMVCNLWPRILDTIMKFGTTKMSAYGEQQRELINMTTVVNADNPDSPTLPDYMYCTSDDLAEYYPQLMTSNKIDGIEYTYGSRLREYFGIDQIQNIIDDLRRENYSRRAVASTWDVETDSGNPKSPCLDIIQAIVQNGSVYLIAYIRSNDMFRAWASNAYGLLKVRNEIADALGLGYGKLIINSGSAHIYERDFISAVDVIKKHLDTGCIPDPRGNFVITTNIDTEEICVRHISQNGQHIQEFRGTDAHGLRDLIYPFISTIHHALYIGEELARAQSAIENHTRYIQG